MHLPLSQWKSRGEQVGSTESREKKATDSVWDTSRGSLTLAGSPWPTPLPPCLPSPSSQTPKPAPS